jgi:uncharacterized membrane protein YczE
MPLLWMLNQPVVALLLLVSEIADVARSCTYTSHSIGLAMACHVDFGNWEIVLSAMLLSYMAEAPWT